MRQLPFHYAFRNLGRNRRRLAASLLGSTLVVLLVLASGGFVRGMQLTLTQRAGLHDNVMILGTGSEEGVQRSQIVCVYGIHRAPRHLNSRAFAMGREHHEIMPE